MREYCTEVFEILYHGGCSEYDDSFSGPIKEKRSLTI